MPRFEKIPFTCMCEKNRACYYLLNLDRLKHWETSREVSCSDLNDGFKNCPHPHKKMTVKFKPKSKFMTDNDNDGESTIFQ